MQSEGSPELKKPKESKREDDEPKSSKTKSEIQKKILVEEDDESRFARNYNVMSGKAELDKAKSNKKREQQHVEKVFGEEAPADYSAAAPMASSELDTEFVDPPVQFHRRDEVNKTLKLYRLTKNDNFMLIKTTKLPDAEPSKKAGKEMPCEEPTNVEAPSMEVPRENQPSYKRINVTGEKAGVPDEVTELD